MRTYQKILAVLALSGMCFAAAAPSDGERVTKKKKHHHEAKAKAQSEDIEALKEQLAAQQAEIDSLKAAQQQPAPPTADEKARSAAAGAQQQASSAQQQASAAAATANQANSAAATANSAAASAQSTANAANEQAQVAEKKVSELETPPYIHYKNIRITPGGFLAAETVFRQHAETADVLSSYAGIPYSNNSLSHMTEFRETARQSRATLLAQGNAGKVLLTGYYEADFLGAAQTANENQSNSFNLRQRQLFAQAQWDGWAFTAGQTWSLLTTNLAGIETRREWIPLTIDAQYAVGYTFARLMTMRVARAFDDNKVTAAFSLENPEFSFAGAPGPGLTAIVSSNGIGGGALNNVPTTYSINQAPDLIAKLAFDPSFGHFEIKAIGRFLRDRVIDTGNTSLNTNNTRLAGGVGAAAIIPFDHKKVNFIADGMFGRGIGHYGDSLQTDATLRPDGTISPIKNIRGIAGFEAHATPKLDVYLYGGDEYLGRDYFGATGGYGNPLANLGNANCLLPDSGIFGQASGPNYAGAANLGCNANTKNLLQAIGGFWYNIYKGGYGTLRYGMQYSWTYKTTWQDVSGITPKASESMAFSSLRYYLP